ncbi:hypothetical protein V8C86DRAFT_2613751 [Haematococcus lacustris]
MAIPATTQNERKLAAEVHEEYHDPLDDWSSRDVLLSLVPFIVTYAFKDTALSTAINFSIAWTAFLLIMRTVAYDSRRKHIWPVLDIIGILAFPILRGMIRISGYEIHKWWPVILPGIFAAAAIVSLAIRRPFTAHYARFPKFDRGGKGVWMGDASFRRTNDMATLGYIFAWSVMLFLSLIPILTGHWYTWHVLNIIFNYITPALLLLSALVAQQLLGTWYRSTTANQSVGTTGHVRGTGEASGVVSNPAATPYGTNAV